MTCLQTDSVRPKELFYLFSGWLFHDYLGYLVQHISRDESHSAWSIVLAAGLFLHDTKPLLAAEQSTLQAMGRPASHCWHKLVYHGISFMPLHSLKIDLHSLLTLKWNHYLQKSHRSCQPVTYISQSWALDPIPDLNIIVSGSQLQGSYHSLQFVYPAKAVTSSQQTIYYTGNNTYSNIWIQPEIGTIKCCTVGHIPMGFHGHIWAHIGHRCQWAAPPCFWVEPHGPSSPASSAENWVLGWVKVGTEIRISRIIKNQFHKVRPWFADSTNVFFHFCRAAASANRTCSSGSLTISLSVAVAQRPTSNSDSWRIGPHESIATIHRLAKFSSSQGSLHHIQQYTPPTECHPNKGSRTTWRIDVFMPDCWGPTP